MKSKNNYIARFSIAIILILMFLNSCKFDSIVNVDLSDYKSVLVVNSFFNPDSIWSARISSSQNALDNKTFRNINNSTVEIWKDGLRITALSYKSKGLYQADTIKPLAGKEYEIRVSAPGFKPVTAIGTAPEAAIITNVKVDTITNGDENELELTIAFTDPPTSGNKYHISLWGYGLDDEGKITNKPQAINFSSTDLLLKGDATMNLEFYGDQAVFDDVVMNGKQYNLKLRIMTYYAENDVYVMLSTVSNEYYKYHKSCQKQIENSDNPFSEAVIVYSNIANGLGIFAGYSTSKYTIFD